MPSDSSFCCRWSSNGRMRLLLRSWNNWAWAMVLMIHLPARPHLLMLVSIASHRISKIRKISMTLSMPDKAVRSLSQTKLMICFRDSMRCELDLEPTSKALVVFVTDLNVLYVSTSLIAFYHLVAFSLIAYQLLVGRTVYPLLHFCAPFLQHFQCIVACRSMCRA